MDAEINLRIAGEAGQGLKTMGTSIAGLFRAAGHYVYSNQDYMSRIRGGNNYYQLRVSSRPVSAPRETMDIVVALDYNSVELHASALRDEGLLIFDRRHYRIDTEDRRFFDVPIYAMAEEHGGSALFVNAVAYGVVAGLTGTSLEDTRNNLLGMLHDKSDEIKEKNVGCIDAGYEFVRARDASGRFGIVPASAQPSARMLINGNDAIALGAIAAGCRFYTAYPMTPSTSIMDSLAHYSGRYGIMVEQAEDEIAAINMALGASFAGARSMTGTSGGGLALMSEGISLAAMTETPVVIVDAQRPGPATGFPTRTEQADLMFVLHAGHGEFARALFTPGNPEEAFYLTAQAFDIADRYQIPAFILTDQHLADSEYTGDPFDALRITCGEYTAGEEAGTAYKRYALARSGISPRAVPGRFTGVMYVDSDEHTEEGHITENADIRTSMVEKRFYKKMALLREEIVPPVYGNLDEADIVLLGFGSTRGVIQEAAESIGSYRVGYIHLPQVWPFPADAVRRLLNGARRVVTVENNAGAQLAGLMLRETGIAVKGSILQFNGRPFTVDGLVRRILQEGLE
jgi:2-oxoglutarate ferredoxin oxidoreductase subunit alpha